MAKQIRPASTTRSSLGWGRRGFRTMEPCFSSFSAGFHGPMWPSPNPWRPVCSHVTGGINRLLACQHCAFHYPPSSFATSPLTGPCALGGRPGLPSTRCVLCFAYVCGIDHHLPSSRRDLLRARPIKTQPHTPCSPSPAVSLSFAAISEQNSTSPRGSFQG
jgi:hypothetical protein